MKRILFTIFMLSSLNAFAGGGNVHLDKAPIDPTDYASLQRGAKIFMNTCSACHSLKYARYGTTAKGIGITDDEGNVLEDIVKRNLLFTGDNLSSEIVTALRKEDAQKFFGQAPPDLSLVTRSRGADWVYTFLRTYYKDDSRPWGVNNTTFPDVGMPHVMLSMQGIQEPVYININKVVDNKEVSERVLNKLQLTEPGSLSAKEYDQVVADLVNFLAYVGEPHQVERKRIGVLVMAFLLIFMVFAYLLKREYWKDVH